MRRLQTRFRALFNRATAESDLDDELRFHLDMETEHQMRMGLPENEARQKARREFGGVERYRDESRDARGISSIEDFLRDVKVSMRSLRRAPGFALVSVFTVAFGIGTTTAVFSLIDGILLRPLPYPQADALVRVYERTPVSPLVSFSGANFHDVENRSKTLQSVAVVASRPETILGLAEPLRVNAAVASDRFFEVMGVPAERGRTFLRGEGRSETFRPTVISDRFWRNALHARADWSNMILHTDAGDATVVGIMPAGFSYPTDVDVWSVIADDNPNRTAHNWSLIGRLSPNSSVEQSRIELDGMFGGLKAQLHKDIDAEGVTVRTLREALTARVRTLCFVLLGAVVFVLLVACTNLASANLARGEAQQRELAVRTSLGASRGRLVRQLATEKIVLCAVGGLLGIVLAWALVKVAVALGPGTIPTFATISVDGRVMAFGVVVAILTGLITGTLPALTVTSDLRSMTAAGGGGSGRRGGFRRPLIATEIALATILLIGAGLFLRSFETLLAEDPGYRVERLVLADIALPAAGYSDARQWFGDTITVPRFYTALLTHLRTIPGVDGVAVVNQIPLGGGGAGTQFMIDGGTDTKASADYRIVDSAYFAVMGIPMLHGRGFTSNDRAGTEQVVVINREAAEKFWPGVNPLGHRIRPPGMDAHPDNWLTIVGVIENVRQYGLDSPVTPQMYIHYLQRPERLQSATIVVKTSRPEAVGPALHTAARDIDRNALVELSTMQSLLDKSVAGRKFSMTILSAFSILALFLAAVGIYGVLAYAVIQRQREIGVRMALGSTRGGVRGLILGDSMRAVVPGLIVGLIGALFAVRLISGLLYGIAPVDPMTFIATPAVILGVALAASLWPASRASRVDPMIAMRAE